MDFEMIAKVKTQRNIVKALDEIVEDKTINIDPITDMDFNVNRLLLTYIKLKRYMSHSRDEATITRENRYIVECIIEDIINNIDNDVHLNPYMDKNIKTIK